ncbi:MAG: hypothetical protein ABSA39_06690 [Edaphobacter sp.]
MPKKIRVSGLLKKVVLLKGMASAVPGRPAERPYRSALNTVEGPERSQKGEVTDLIALVFYLKVFSSFSAQKSHVKPQYQLTHFHSSTSAWRISSVSTAIMNIESKKNKAPDTRG